jgi:hypothetical protein
VSQPEHPSRRSVLLGVPAAAIGAGVASEVSAEMATPSPEYHAYRQAFDGFLAAIDAGGSASDASDALDEAIEALRRKPVRSWSDVSEVAIMAHDHTWDRRAQNYVARCPQKIVRDLILAVLTMQPGDAMLHAPPPRPSMFRSPTTINN